VQTLVFDELFAQAELAPTRGALKGPLAGVKKQVVAQQRRNPEPLSAQRALVSQQAVAVFAHVLPQQAVQPERLAALGTGVRLDAGVSGQVRAEARALVEGPAARRTPVGTLSGMQAHMNGQPVRQRLAADRARVPRLRHSLRRRPRPVLVGHVPTQSPHLRERLAALSAPMLLLLRLWRFGSGRHLLRRPRGRLLLGLGQVRDHVHVEEAALGEAGPAVGADEPAVRGVRLHVPVEVDQQREGAPADVALDRLIARMRVHVLLKPLPVGQHLPAHLTGTWSLLRTTCRRFHLPTFIVCFSFCILFFDSTRTRPFRTSAVQIGSGTVQRFQTTMHV